MLCSSRVVSNVNVTCIRVSAFHDQSSPFRTAELGSFVRGSTILASSRSRVYSNARAAWGSSYSLAHRRVVALRIYTLSITYAAETKCQGKLECWILFIDLANRHDQIHACPVITDFTLRYKSTDHLVESPTGELA